MKPKEIADHLIQNRKATRTRRGQVCPVCGHFDNHCLRMDDDSAALCPKADGTGSVKKYGEYGYLYILSPGLQSNDACLPPVKRKPERTDQEMDDLWRPRVKLWCDRGRSEIGRLAMALGVSTDSLRHLGAGWDGKAWTFPERNGGGLIVGVSRRFEDGSKRCAVGSRRGLTYGDGWRAAAGPVLIVEGASDVAAGITLGLSVAGRPSNVGGLTMLVGLLGNQQSKILVIGERDRKPDGRWPGMAGSHSIAAGLGKALRRTVSSRLMPDGAKDLRAWLNGRGIDVSDCEACREAGMYLVTEFKKER